jgi:hypothetical protein
VIKGYVHFPKDYIGNTFTMEDGQEFLAFRHLVVDPKKGNDRSCAIFKVRFKFSSLALRINKRLSLIPTPFLIAKRGFKQKLWMINDKGFFQGIYEWESEESAEKYPESFIFKMMTKRSETGTVSYEVIPDILLSDYFNTLIK